MNNDNFKVKNKQNQHNDSDGIAFIVAGILIITIIATSPNGQKILDTTTDTIKNTTHIDSIRGKTIEQGVFMPDDWTHKLFGVKQR